MHPPAAAARWTARLAVAAFFVGVATTRVPQRDAIASPVDVEITGAAYRWIVRYAGADGVLGTRDDRIGEGDLHVPRGLDVHVRLASRDYVYTVSLPAFGQEQIAVPDMVFELHLRAEEVGRSPLHGDEMCGLDHPDLERTVFVQEPRAWLRWLEALPTAAEIARP